MPIDRGAGVTTWGLGAYPLIAARLEAGAIAAVDLAVIQPGDRVLDIATGTGNAALAAAARGADVVGVDFESTLLVQAAERSTALGLKVRWENSDATALPVSDRWADVVLSVFGIMYVPDQELAARELARCAAPGSRIVLTSWIPGSFMPAMGNTLSGFLPEPTSSGPPSRWGDRDALDHLVAPFGLELVAHSTETLTLDFADAEAAVDFLVRTAGHVLAEQQSLTVQGRWGDLLACLGELVQERARPFERRLCIDLQYLLASMTPH